MPKRENHVSRAFSVTPLLLAFVLLAGIVPVGMYFASEGAAQQTPTKQPDATLQQEFEKLLDMKPAPAAVPFRPACANNDQACEAWKTFRTGRPYPYQAIVAQPLADRSLALVISEPEPAMSKSAFEQLVREAFGKDLLDLKRHRWMIGIDGWLEDLVLRVARPAGQEGAGDTSFAGLLKDPLFRDRIAALNVALHGTVFGAHVEVLDGKLAASATMAAAPNLRISSKELRDWVTDSTQRWRAVDGEATPDSTWATMVAQKTVGTFVSGDGSLVLFTLPSSFLKTSPATPRDTEELRAPFRQFAVATDSILGGVWTGDGHIAIVGRARHQPLDVVPPLRFQTLAMFARWPQEELQQSYERNQVFAGKMRSGGPFPFRDWAPILLSKSLIDTEFGALLNITDQMLKSWSLAGQTQYIYFDYPMQPKSYPFEKPLSAVLREKYGASSTQFNWNTAGLASVVKSDSLSVLTTKQTGALPITYGSEMRGGNMQFGHLLVYEDAGYNYFAGLKDPNLARVVQYTMLYQVFYAVSTGNGTPSGAQSGPGPLKAGTDVFVLEATDLLKKIDGSAEAAQAIRQFEQKYPGIGRPKLTALLVDKASLSGEDDGVSRQLKEAEARFNERQHQFKDKVDSYNARVRELSRDIDRYNSSRGRVGSRQELERRESRIDSEKSALDAEQSSLERAGAELERKVKYQFDLRNDVHALQRAVRTFYREAYDSNRIREAYIAANEREPTGPVKTPSVVLSWNKSSIFTVGGHNIGARALRFEASPSVRGIEIVETADGPVLRYHPDRADAVAARSTDLSRLIEHAKERDLAKLEAMLRDLPPPRARSAALELPAAPTRSAATHIEKVAGPLGPRAVAATDGRTVVKMLQEISAKAQCCVFVMRDADQTAYAVERNLIPPPTATVTAFGDNLSVVARLEKEAAKSSAKPPGEPIIFLGQGSAHVDALLAAVHPLAGKPGVMSSIKAFFGVRPVAANDNMIISHVDSTGRRGTLELVPKGANLQGRAATLAAQRVSGIAAEVRSLGREEIARLLEGVTLPGPGSAPIVATSVSFRTVEAGGRDIKVSVFSRVTAGKAAPAQEILKDTTKTSADKAVERGSWITEHMLAIKQRLSTLPDFDIKQLMFILEEGTDRVHFTEDRRPWNAGPGRMPG